MPTYVVNTDEIVINQTRFPLKTDVEHVLTAVFPAKTVIGEYGSASDPNISSWTVDDQRGGIGAERVSSDGGANRCWWSTCRLDQKGHITLPRLTSSLGIQQPSLTIVNADCELTSGWTGGTGARSNLDAQGGSYSWYRTHPGTDLAGGAGTWSSGGAQTITTGFTPGAEYTIALYQKITTVNPEGSAQMRVKLTDSTGTTAYTTTLTGTSTVWTVSTGVLTTSLAATSITIEMQWKVPSDDDLSGGHTYNYFWDTFGCTIATYALTTPIHFCNFNGYMYASSGSALYKLNATADSFELVGVLPTTINALCASVNSCLYIGQGDAAVYYYMSTAHAFTATNTMDVTLLQQWDSKLFKMDNDGNCWYCAAPNSATPTWVATGNITDVPSGTIKHLLVAFDSNGDTALYAAGGTGLKVLDFANGIWLDTAVALEHPNGGKGAALWRDSLNFSAGLEVVQYDATAASITEHGLSNESVQLPSEYNGEIVFLTSGYSGRMFALVDATQSPGTTYSGVYAWTGNGWEVWWTDSSTETVPTTGVVSSASGVYRLYFAVGSTVYYVWVPRGVTNMRLSTDTMGQTGVHITPWFDGGWAQGIKTALNIRLKVNTTGATYTVVVKYRLDYDTTAVASTWTTLGTITTSGETTYSFGSGVGVPFRAIQFRFDLQQGASSYGTPDIEWFALSYMQSPASLATSGGGWGYRATVDCTAEYAGKNPAQLIDALVSAAETSRSTLIPFSVRPDVEYNGRITGIQGAVESGERKQGQYVVFITVP